MNNNTQYQTCFDQAAPRVGTSCIKWDLQKEEFGTDGLLPFTIADADYAACPSVLDAVRERTNLGVLGYTEPSAAYYEAVLSWCQQRHHFDISPEWILPVSGIIPGISYVLEALTAPGDMVVVQTPVYDPFYTVIAATGRRLAENRLVRDEALHYTMDLDQLENLFREGAKAMILCNPHNPVGRVWTAEELAAVTKLCRAYQVLLISDEIHWDLIFDQRRHISAGSFLTPDLLLVLCTSASKSFNIAGLQTSNFIIPDDTLRGKLRAWLEGRYLFCPNTLGLTATEAAYRTGADWLDAQISYLEGNRDLAVTFLHRELPWVRIAPLEGTYLMWLDFTKSGMTSAELVSLFAKHGATLGNGVHYGQDHDGFIRLNIACPRRQLEQGLVCMAKAMREILGEVEFVEADR